jgi:hypothetical protein
VIAGDDHRTVGVVGLDGLKGAPPFGRVELAAEVLLDCQVERLAMLADGLKEKRASRACSAASALPLTFAGRSSLIQSVP